MKSNKSKVILMAVIIILVLILAGGGAFAYIYFGTDLLKSNEELFLEYANQTITKIGEAIDTNKIQEMNTRVSRNNSESKTTLSIDSEVMEELNQISLSIDTKNDVKKQKLYNDIKLGFGETEPMEVEYMLTSDTISLRLTNAVKQFLTIQNKNTDELAEKLGLEEENLSTIFDLLLYKSSSKSIQFSEEEKNSLKETYLNVIKSCLTKDNFKKQSNVMVTINGNTITTNTYNLTLAPENYKDILQKVIEQLKSDTVILQKIGEYESSSKNNTDKENLKTNMNLDNLNTDNEEETEPKLQQMYIDYLDEILTNIKNEKFEDYIVFTIYEKNEQTARIKIEKGFYTITIDTIENDEMLGINTKIDTLEEQAENTLEFNLTKYKSEYYNLALEIKDSAREDENIIIEAKVTNNDSNLTLEITTEDIVNGDSTKLSILSEIDFVQEITDMLVFEENNNNITINNLTKEKYNQILGLVTNAATQTYGTSINNITQLILSNMLGEAGDELNTQTETQENNILGN